jgi:hypothetical protein
MLLLTYSNYGLDQDPDLDPELKLFQRRNWNGKTSLRFHNIGRITVFSSVLRIRIRDSVMGSKIGFFSGSRIPDLGSRIPNPYLVTNFWVKNSIIL